MRTCRGNQPAQLARRETIYLTAIDREGNIVSLIQSNSPLGTALVPRGPGFPFQNRGAGFNLTPGKPNSLAGHKRPLHTIIPAFMEKGRYYRVRHYGRIQPGAGARAIRLGIVDLGMNIQAALEAPRFTKLTFDGCDVRIESRIPAAVRDELTRRGHILKVVEPFSFGVVGRGWIR